MTEPIDFTPCERLPGRAYNGANGRDSHGYLARILQGVPFSAVQCAICEMMLMGEEKDISFIRTINYDL